MCIQFQKHPQSEFCTLKKWFLFVRRERELQFWRQDGNSGDIMWKHSYFLSPVAFVVCFYQNMKAEVLPNWQKHQCEAGVISLKQQTEVIPW